MNSKDMNKNSSLYWLICVQFASVYLQLEHAPKGKLVKYIVNCFSRQFAIRLFD